MPSSRLSEQAIRVLRGAALVAILGAGVSACVSGPRPYPSSSLDGPSTGSLHGTNKPYEINGHWYYPQANPHYDEVGTASWYGYPSQERHTADGELFDETLISAAHKTLPLPCIVEVTNLENGRRLQVRVNDRGPFVDGRLIDLSKAAARQLGFDRQGVTRVRVRYISAAPPLPASGLMLAAYRRPSSATTQPLSVDGFDGIEQADAGGHIRPASASDAAAIPAEGDEGPPPTSRSASAIRSSALPAASAAAVGPYAVQAGAFGSRYAADRAVTRLSATGSAQVTPIQRKGGILYRVTVGGFSDASAAAAAKLKVIAQGFTDAKVVQAE